MEYFTFKEKRKEKKRTRRSCWMKEWLIKRDWLSAYNTIFKELHLNDYCKETCIIIKKVVQEINKSIITIVIFFTNTLQQIKIWIFLLGQENYFLLTSTNFNLLKTSLQNKRARVIYVHLYFLNQNRFDLKILNRDQIFEILWNFKVLVSI